MPFCAKCGNMLDVTAKFCGKCGTPVIRINSSENEYSLLATSTKKTKKQVQSLVLLALSEKIKVNDNKFPDILFKYGIGFPKEILSKLSENNYIKIASAKESINNCTLQELKEIARVFEIKTSGKKEEVCNRLIDELSEEQLSIYVKNRYWELTDDGQKLLHDNPYIEYILDNHKYNLERIEIDVFTLADLWSSSKSKKLRDVLWGEFNRKATIYYKKAIKSKDFSDYCYLFEIMALFLEEEKKYKDALNQYINSIFYSVNFNIGLLAIDNYQQYKSEIFLEDYIFTQINIYLNPFVIMNLLRLCEESELDSKQLKVFLLDVFMKEPDSGIFTNNELADYLIYDIEKNKEMMKKICSFASKRIIAMTKK